MVNNVQGVLTALFMRVSPFILALPILFILSSRPISAERGEKTFPEIGVRNAHAMAYDNGRGRVILFGGADESKVCGDTWEWGEIRWVQKGIGETRRGIDNGH